MLRGTRGIHLPAPDNTNRLTSYAVPSLSTPQMPPTHAAILRPLRLQTRFTNVGEKKTINVEPESTIKIGYAHRSKLDQWTKNVPVEMLGKRTTSRSKTVVNGQTATERPIAFRDRAFVGVVMAEPPYWQCPSGSPGSTRQPIPDFQRPL